MLVWFGEREREKRRKQWARYLKVPRRRGRRRDAPLFWIFKSDLSKKNSKITTSSDKATTPIQPIPTTTRTRPTKTLFPTTTTRTNARRRNTSSWSVSIPISRTQHYFPIPNPSIPIPTRGARLLTLSKRCVSLLQFSITIPPNLLCILLFRFVGSSC